MELPQEKIRQIFESAEEAFLRKGGKYHPKVHYFVQVRYIEKFSCLKISQSYKNSQSL
jgi:hypothetical protein